MSKIDPMKTLTLYVVALFATSSLAQTPIIAHKSHAGSASNFFIEPSSNFGAIMEPHELRIRQKEVELKQNPVYIDTLQVNDSVRYINYRNNNQEIIQREVQSVPMVAKKQTSQPVKSAVESKQIQRKSKPKRSYLLFLFSITFGGLFATRLFIKN